MLPRSAGGERDNGRRRSSGGREDPRHVKLRAVKQMLAEVGARVFRTIISIGLSLNTAMTQQSSHFLGGLNGRAPR